MRAHNLNTEELQVNSQSVVPSIGKNALINGNFDIWQRGTSFTTGYTADRWNIGLTGETGTVSRQTFTPGQADVPGNPKYYLRAAITTGGAAANALAILTQYIEGVEKHSGETVTISFYAKASSGTPDIVTEFVQFFGASGSDNVYTYCDAHTLSTSWQKFTVTVDVPSISGKTIGTADDALVFVFWFSAGSNYAARTGSLGQQSITCDIAQVQVEKGTVATEFERRHLQYELALCQRYYESVNMVWSGDVTTSTVYYTNGYFKVTKRGNVVSGDCTIGTASVSGFPSAAPTFVGADTNYLRVSMTANTTGAGGWYTLNIPVDVEF